MGPWSTIFGGKFDALQYEWSDDNEFA